VVEHLPTKCEALSSKLCTTKRNKNKIQNSKSPFLEQIRTYDQNKQKDSTW
jgi:hypothetical protein